MSKCYQFFADGYYAGAGEAYGGRLPANATFVPPPPGPWIKKWPRYVGKEWTLEEDHRERKIPLFSPELAQEATDYWLPEEGDDWKSQPRKMIKIGPLPHGAVLTRPERPEDELVAEAKDRKMSEIAKGYETAMASSFLTLPMQDASATDLAVEAALLVADDADGLKFVAQLHSERRNELMALVIAAETREELENIKVAYAV